MRSLLCLILVLGSSALASIRLPSPEVRSNIADELASTMLRLDGEALYVRSNRSLSWQQVTKNLKDSAALASSWNDFAKVLRQLDQAYPNLHSRGQLGKDYRQFFSAGVGLGVHFKAEWIAPNKVRYVISGFETSVSYPSEISPKVGDEIIAINDRNIESWKLENFEFCKFPLKEQCDFIFAVNFQGELLSWNSKIPLSFSLKRGPKEWKIAVPVNGENDAILVPALDTDCKKEKGRYSDDFKLVYGGTKACIYESRKHQNTAILRITSFNYGDVQNEDVKSLQQEVDALYTWWKANATWDDLVIDVINNHGGEAGIPYYQILLRQDFQEQFVQFKKINEMEDATLRESIFWGDLSHEIWFQDYRKTGAWDKMSHGEYTKPSPMFCPDPNKNCSEGLFPVRDHSFKGRVSILVNEWCVSSCDAFAYTMKEAFSSKARFYGHPQAGDTAYSRLRLNVYLDGSSAKGFRLEIAPLMAVPADDVLLTQTVGVTRSTDKSGKITSGFTVPLDGFTPETLENRNSWPSEVLKYALADIQRKKPSMFVAN